MTPRDLHTGMVITCRDGKEYMVVKDIVQSGYVNDRDVALDLESHQYFNLEYDENMNDRTGCEWDAMKIETITDYYDVTNFRGATRRVIWERPTVKKQYTYEQIKEILGEEFEIVKE